MPTPADIIGALDASATRAETPCGAGTMVWRRWGAGEPLILLHGGSGSWLHWIRTIPALAVRYEVWAADMPGLGDSAMPMVPHTPATCGSIVADGISRILPREQRPHMVCFSFGAHVGTLAAAELGHRVRSLTLSGSAALGLPHGRADFAKEHARMTAEERAEVHRGNLHILMIADATRIDALAIHIQAENIARTRFRSRIFAATDEIKRALPRVTAPLGEVWAANDQIAKVGGAEARLAVLRASHPDLVARIVPDAGHWAMYEQPDAFNAALIEVIAVLEARSAIADA